MEALWAWEKPLSAPGMEGAGTGLSPVLRGRGERGRQCLGLPALQRGSESR